MPEGPEVRKIVDQLQNNLKLKVITEIHILSGRYKKHGDPDGFLNFSNNLPLTINDIDCKGKFIYFTCQDILGRPHYIWNTLGMSGGWSLEQNHHSRVKIRLNDSSYIYFNDMRNFGTLHFVSSSKKMQEKLESLGPDFLQENITDLEFRNRLIAYSSFKTLPEALMDQSIFSGVGNYLKAEALYVAKIAPTRIVNTLSQEEFSSLNSAIQRIIRESYKTGGSTFKVYQDLYGQVGSYSERFMVYGRNFDPQGNKVLRLKTKDGRATHWVPAIQK